ncbi:MAG: GH36-type glycosyl hydrolase domain-containing protein [Hyphomicrobiales bacterium]
MRHLLGRLFQQETSPWNDSQPIRAELFGIERFREHAHSLARSQTAAGPPVAVYSVVRRLRDDARSLLEAYKELSANAAAGRPITPATEWLIDNYHLIQEQVRQTMADLPQGFYRQLPKIAAGPLAGHPQIFGIAWAYVAHTDSRFDPHPLTEFVNAYQEVQPLTIGELWAAAISLRLVLIENLTRIATRTVAARRAREAADQLADRLLDRSAQVADLESAVPAGAVQHAQLSFAVQLIKRLRDQDAVEASVLDWLRQKVHALGYDYEGAVNDEHHRQAAANVTMRNLVTSLRFISDYNWEDWFESVSTVDRMLRTSSLYGEMDFRTRNDYRNAIEDLSQHSRYGEPDIARLALEHAAAAREAESAAATDPGYHIVGPGRASFESAIGYRPPWRRRIADAVRASGLAGYLGAIFIIAAIALCLGLWPLARTGVAVPLLVLLAVLGLGPAVEAGMAMVNYALTQLLRPVVLLGLALRDGVPGHLRTLVAVPALLSSHEEIEELVERLEVHYLANSTGELYFALLTDWTDSTAEHAPDDDALLAAALEAIARLNRQYGNDRFLLLHRSRRWNPQQGKWMGWERKRGKLHELNRLLRGAADTSYMAIGGRLPPAVRFVITLDADTKLPRDAARRLVGKLVHPLNRPHVDAGIGRVVEGYGVMQPRVTPSLPVENSGTKFQRIFSTRRGSDPYVFAVSDVYQDLFGEGSYAGKGIYDIDAFESALAGRIPENALLSHDLFEGIFARTALVSDVEVVEEHPERYAVAAARQHRWVRGDWQLLPWIAGRAAGGASGANRWPPPLGHWKMIDNLRRSLTPVLSLLALMAGWLWLSGPLAAAWTAFVAFVIFVPAFLPVFSGSSLRHVPFTVASQLSTIANDVAQALTLTAAHLVFLGHQAGLMADAIGRTLYRLFVSRRNLLEWATAAQVQSGTRLGLPGHYRLMASSIAAGLFTFAIAAFRGDGPALSALPFAMLWLAAPAIACWMSQPDLPDDELAASPADRLALRFVARRTWTYFETFVGPGDNMLPPDNFQEDPKPVVAHRTSPTNIGLYLLSIAGAREFGWLGLSDAIARIEATLATVHKMEKCKGHLYNWYDTESLRPLEPKYVSAVDSGNLAAHLVALANMCSHWSLQPTTGAQYLDGIEDAAGILGEELLAVSQRKRSLKQAGAQIDQQLSAFQRSIALARNAPELIPLRLVDLAVQAGTIHQSIVRLAALDEANADAAIGWASVLQQTIDSQFRDASLDAVAAGSIQKRLEAIAADARKLAMAMEFGFLSDPQRNLMSIGYRVAESTLDENCYDMLASEAALASFLAIAKGDLRARHWFRLARPVTALHGGAALVSWSGSMFEYLMPALVLRAPAGSLLEQTARLIVRRQIEYGNTIGTPWGISESAFNARDVHFTYQYSNFGVPGLGLKRGLADNAVIAPYATALAAMVAPRAATENFAALTKAGGRGSHGFYEALDFTPERLRSGEKVAVVKAYFAHHQGMTIAAILNAVGNGVFRNQFHAEPIVRATELLLQERAPRRVPVELASVAVAAPANIARDLVAPPPRRADPRFTQSPITHLLSNGQYSAMLTAAGTGYSTWNGLAINRWREDPTCDDWGAFVFLRDLESGATWPAGHMPAVAEPDTYSAEFAEEKVEFRRTDGTFTTSLECLVSTEDNSEARRVSIVNSGITARIVEVTTYMELVLAPAAADNAHLAFSKLFVETEYVEGLGTLLATRRRRSPSEPEIWVAQLMLVQGTPSGAVEFETSREQFIGQGNDIHSAAAIMGGKRLTRTTGAVLDPVFALRRRVRISPGRQASCTIWTMVAESREAVLDLVDRHRQHAAYERAQILAWTQARIQLRHLSIEAHDSNLFQHLAGYLIYSSGTLRASSSTILSNMHAQSALWPLGISGTKPLLLVRIDAVEDIEIVRQLLRAHEYWSAKRLAVDLVILNDRRASYMQDLQTAIDDLIRRTRADAAGGAMSAVGQIYALRADLLPQQTLAMLPAVARVVLSARSGSLASQLARVRTAGPFAARTRPPVRRIARPGAAGSSPVAAGLAFFNGYGGFDEERGEYVILHDPHKPTPAPWINVIANPHFGTHCAADGGGYTWTGNSRESQITGWANDPVGNRPGEAVYVRDEDTGVLTGPCVAPLRHGHGVFRTRHGFGYTLFESEDAGLRMEFLQIVATADTVKIGRLRIATDSDTPRELSVIFYAELVLGSWRAASAPFITTEIDSQTGAMFVRNRWNPDFGERVVFADLCGRQTTWTGDREEFLGRFGSLAAPRVPVLGETLSNRTGGGLDPCAALQQNIMVTASRPVDVTILFGAASNDAEARILIERYRLADPDAILAEVKSYWADTLGAVKVRTPDRAFNILLNGWLLYQTLACRMWARSGYYQASGAYGFRDQLQDSMALAGVRPDIARQHILRAAARQFVEGDVQHWWLPASGMGVRTRISDDTLWLAYCALHYIKTTGDTAILDETVPFLDGRALQPGEHDAFYQPAAADRTATLYEHCALAVERSLLAGPHGLPLIGGGDWNDGMNRVGEQGRGESVWLGWFLFATLKAFEPVAAARADRRRVAAWRKRMASLQLALDEHGWDGNWYRRGYFDDGTPLGSAQNAECRIDAIAQSWAVISGAGRPERAAAAMDAAHRELVRSADGVALLFTPPFDISLPDPGYIKAYPPGVRENGGQYTHGAIWSIFAHAKLGQAEKAAGLFALINPVNHARNEAEIRRYRVEPYVIAADVYSMPPYAGRGGWTWYTGAAGWMYRAGLEAILGVVQEGRKLRVKPCIPAGWPEFHVSIRCGKTRYEITVTRNKSKSSTSDPRVQRVSPAEYLIELQDNGGTARIELIIDDQPMQEAAKINDSGSQAVA